MKKDGLHYLLQNGIEYESFLMHDLVYWNPFDARIATREELYDEPLAIHIHAYSDGNYYLSYDWNMGGRETNVFVNKDNKIQGFGARSEKETILKFIEWYRENGKAHYKENSI